MLHLAIALFQTRLDWGEDLRAAQSRSAAERRLVLFEAGDADSELYKLMEASVLTDGTVRRSLGDLILVRNPAQGLRFSKPDVPTFVLLDEDSQVRGYLGGPAGPKLFAEWLTGVKDTWKSRDALLFRAKGHPSERDLVRLALYYGSSMELDRASQILQNLGSNKDVLGKDLALYALAQSLEFAKKKEEALDVWLNLEAHSRSPEYRAASMIHSSLLVWDEQRETAIRKLRSIAGLPGASDVDRRVAEYWLERAIVDSE